MAADYGAARCRRRNRLAASLTSRLKGIVRFGKTRRSERSSRKLLAPSAFGATGSDPTEKYGSRTRTSENKRLVADRPREQSDRSASCLDSSRRKSDDRSYPHQ